MRTSSITTIGGRWRSWAPYLQSIVRIAAAFLIILPGAAKLFAFPEPVLPGAGISPILSLAGIGGILEIVGGLLLLVGLFTRPAAFILSGEMAVAYLMFHAPQSFWPIINHGELAFIYCFFWLYISAAGPGPWSLDALRRSDSARPGMASRSMG